MKHGHSFSWNLLLLSLLSKFKAFYIHIIYYSTSFVILNCNVITNVIDDGGAGMRIEKSLNKKREFPCPIEILAKEKKKKT